MKYAFCLAVLLGLFLLPSVFALNYTQINDVYGLEIRTGDVHPNAGDEIILFWKQHADAGVPNDRDYNITAFDTNLNVLAEIESEGDIWDNANHFVLADWNSDGYDEPIILWGRPQNANIRAFWWNGSYITFGNTSNHINHLFKVENFIDPVNIIVEIKNWHTDNLDLRIYSENGTWRGQIYIGQDHTVLRLWSENNKLYFVRARTRFDDIHENVYLNVYNTTLNQITNQYILNGALWEEGWRSGDPIKRHPVGKIFYPYNETQFWIQNTTGGYHFFSVGSNDQASEIADITPNETLNAFQIFDLYPSINGSEIVSGTGTNFKVFNTINLTPLTSKYSMPNIEQIYIGDFGSTDVLTLGRNFNTSSLLSYTCGDMICGYDEDIYNCPQDCCDYNINTCQDLDQANKVYCLNESITQNVGDTCMDIKADNVTFNCNGNSITGSNYYSETIRIQSNDTNIENCVLDGSDMITQSIVVYSNMNNTKILNVTAYHALDQILFAEYQTNLNITNSNMSFVSKPFVIRNSENVYIDNLTAYSYIYTPFFEYNMKNVDVKNSNFYNFSESGIAFRDVSSGYSEGIEVHDNTFNKQIASSGHCIKFYGNINGIDVRNNYCNGTNTNNNVIGNNQVAFIMDINISNFNISNNYAENTRHLVWCNNCNYGNIENNTGKTFYGAITVDKSFINIRNNYFVENIRQGIQAGGAGSGRFNVTNNTIVSDRYAFLFYGALGNNIFRNNNGTTAIRQSYYFSYYNDISEMYTNDVDTSNIANGKSVLYLKSLNNIVLDNPNTNILLVLNSSNVTLKNLYFNNAYQAMVIGGVNNSMIKDSIINNTAYGFDIESCNNLTVKNVKSLNNFYGFIYGVTSNLNIYDSAVSGSSTIDIYGDTGSASFINTTYNTRTLLNGAELFRKWWLGGQVQVSGLPLIMHVQIKDQLGNIVYEDNTDDFNLLFTQYREFNNGTTYTENQTPHNVTLTRDGYYPPTYTIDLNTNIFRIFDLSPRGQGTEPMLESIGQGIGSLLRNMSGATVILIILLAVGSMVGFIITSLGKKIGGKV